MRGDGTVLAGIKCQAFRGREPATKDITGRLSRGRNPLEKARLAMELRAEADALLGCTDYKPGNRDCANCRALAMRRVKTAEKGVRVQGGSPRR
jgi:hypothetical protein